MNQANAAEAYQCGVPIRELSRRFGVSRPTIDRWLNTAGVKKQAPYVRKFADSTFFDIWTSESTYWLGFLLADGNITPNRNGIRVRIKRSDSHHLRHLAETLHYPAEIRPDISGHGAPIACLEINCRPLVRRLDSLGWFGFKNEGDTTILDAIPQNLSRCLLRGLFDGDGGLSFKSARSNNHATHASFTFHDLHESVVVWYRNKLVSLLNISSPRTHHPNASYSVEWGGNQQVRRILEYLYEESGPRLLRKHMKFQRIGLSTLEWKQERSYAVAP